MFSLPLLPRRRRAVLIEQRLNCRAIRTAPFFAVKLMRAITAILVMVAHGEHAISGGINYLSPKICSLAPTNPPKQ